MKILKVLNNNVIVAEEASEELIVMGRGLAFGRKMGEDVPDDLIEKRYVLSQTDANELQCLLKDIPAEIIEMADQIISYARAHIEAKFCDHALLTMADHLHGVVLRAKDDLQLRNFLIWDIKRFFPYEYQAGLLGKKLLSAYLDIEITDDEAGFIALSLVNSELNQTGSAAQDLTRLMEEILTIVKYSLEIPLDENNIYVQRFMTHLKFFCERVLANTSHNILEDNEMFDLLKCKYPLAYDTTQKIAAYLAQTRHYTTSEDEQMYLTIHLSRIKQG